jgi:hypothetical protein
VQTNPVGDISNGDQMSKPSSRRNARMLRNTLHVRA